MRTVLFIVYTLPVYCISTVAYGQISNSISRDKDRPFALGGGVGYGEFLNRNAWNWGINVDGSRRLKNSDFGLGVSLMFDSETERESNNRPVGSLVSAISIAYLLNDMFSFGTGLGKEFISNGNEARDYEFTNGDWGTGLFLVFQPKRIRKSSISLIYQYNLTNGDKSISLDLGYLLPL